MSARKRAMSPGGCLFTVGVVALVLFFGIFRLVTGHLPEHSDYIVWAFIAFSIFVEAYIEILNTIEESTSEIKTEIKDEMERLEDKIEGEIERLERKIEDEIGKLEPK
jgi:hypothetical protein